MVSKLLPMVQNALERRYHLNTLLVSGVTMLKPQRKGHLICILHRVHILGYKKIILQ